MDITNATSTDLSIAVSTIIGAVIGLWIYNTQKKTANKQDESLRLTNTLETSHYKVLKSIQQVQKCKEEPLSITELPYSSIANMWRPRAYKSNCPNKIILCSPRELCSTWIGYQDLHILKQELVILPKWVTKKLQLKVTGDWRIGTNYNFGIMSSISIFSFFLKSE